jgi:hypothetical protein
VSREALRGGDAKRKREVSRAAFIAPGRVYGGHGVRGRGRVRFEREWAAAW